MQHAATLPASDALPRPVHYLSGDTLTLYPLVLLSIPEAFGDAVQTDGTLPVAQGVRLLFMPTPPLCSLCGNAPAVAMVEGWGIDGEDSSCAVCLLGESGGAHLGVVPVSQVEGVEA